MRSAHPTLLAFALLVAPPCEGQNLLGKLQGQWTASKDSTQVILIEDSEWVFSNSGYTSTYAIKIREWVVDKDDGQRQIVHDEAILISQSDTMTIRIDCACGDTLYLSDGPFPQGAIYRRVK